MDKSPDSSSRNNGRGGKTNLASCLVATAFLALVAGVLTVVFFVVIRPREPKIEVRAVQFPGFAAGNGTVRFTFAQYAAVSNPNRASFSHYDSNLQLIYSGKKVGFMYIPAGEIDGGRTQNMAATFDVDPFPVVATAAGAGGGGSLLVESRMRVRGKVRVLRFLTHHMEAVAACRVGMSVRDGSVLGFRC